MQLESSCFPLTTTRSSRFVTQAHAKGIKVLDYSDNALPHVDGWVIFDNLQGAKLVGTYAGQWVNNTLGGKAQVAMLTHNIQLTGRQRTGGCLAALQKVAPGAKLVAQHEGVLSPQTLAPAQSMLEAHPGHQRLHLHRRRGLRRRPAGLLGHAPECEPEEGHVHPRLRRLCAGYPTGP